MTNVVTVQNVRKIYGKKNTQQFQALNDVSFTVAQGEFVGIMGASGSGKTTLLNTLSTLDKPTSGTITINNQDVTKLKGNQLANFRAQQIGFIFQDFNLLDNLTAFENIALPLSLQKAAPKVIKQKVTAIAEKLGLEPYLQHYPAQLSGGQKQRVSAARALINEPAILFGDEPTGALDSKSARALLDTMTKVNQEEQTSILMVTHDPFSASFCQRILFIKDGQIGLEIKRGEKSRTQFYHQVLDNLGTFVE
ncbi:ABC transporter ATP-binding protein [Bombilactobacillus thymidiniphilus]|uniref:ABC transporter ATP-binding protein n=1 Tax=Bombilactobacillus thymidiniphilus TaxID=2923363 RepID=A0ABY4PEU3_9LACO|nr:ABC transporter ATP-binding protein [Bombilactobacillus thymidiniphilus]UQS84107.1 ABC transporter ATP-binding protein [Bombilactobacillus thymidiniphilus]